MIYTYRTRVYYQDTDAGGMVYHGNYLSIGERARTEALREMGAPHAQLVEAHGVMFVVHRVKLHYQRPAKLDDAIRVETEFHGLGGASISVRQSFYRDDTTLAVLEADLACLRLSDHKAARIPREWMPRLKTGMGI